jgi:hypothetical protein
MNETDPSIADELGEALSERIKQQARMPNTGSVGAPRSQLADFMKSSVRMMELQRGFIQEAESDYQIERVRLLDSYRVKIENLKYEASVMVRDLDEAHQRKVGDARKLLDALVTMRNMPL